MWPRAFVMKLENFHNINVEHLLSNVKSIMYSLLSIPLLLDNPITYYNKNKILITSEINVWTVYNNMENISDSEKTVSVFTNMTSLLNNTTKSE